MESRASELSIANRDIFQRRHAASEQEKNIEHPTSNAQHRTGPALMLRWELDVRCWMFDVWARQNCREDESRISKTFQRAVPLAFIALLRVPFDKRHSVAAKPSFPLTLTLSLWEREQPPPGACIAQT